MMDEATDSRHTTRTVIVMILADKTVNLSRTNVAKALEPMPADGLGRPHGRQGPVYKLAI